MALIGLKEEADMMAGFEAGGDDKNEDKSNKSYYESDKDYYVK